MIKSFQAKNFRGFEEISVEPLGRVNLFVGKNGCGKTSLLEAMALCVNPTILSDDQIVTYRVKNLEHWLFSNGDMQSDIELHAELLPSGFINTSVWGSDFDKERFISTSERSEIVMKKLNESYAKYPQIKSKRYIEFNQTAPTLEIQLESSNIIHDKGMIVSNRGSNKPPVCRFFSSNIPLEQNTLASLYSKLAVDKSEASLIEALQLIQPKAVDIRLTVVDGTEHLFLDIGASHRMPIEIMGGGITRLLEIILGIINSGDGYVFVDEIENGFHYSIQQKLWETIFSTAKKSNVQVFATTHSWECVTAAARAAELLTDEDFRLHRVERDEDGKSRVVTFDKESLATAIELNWEVR